MEKLLREKSSILVAVNLQVFWISLFALLTVAPGCAGSESHGMRDGLICASLQPEEIKTVPLIRLVANPQPYHGKCVATSGFISFGFEDDAVFLSIDDYRNYNYNNSLYMVIPSTPGVENYDEDFYKDHKGVVVGVVEDFTDGSVDKTIIHLYKTKYQMYNIPIEKDLISREVILSE